LNYCRTAVRRVSALRVMRRNIELGRQNTASKGTYIKCDKLMNFHEAIISKAIRNSSNV
jgi:hypothetical protein